MATMDSTKFSALLASRRTRVSFMPKPVPQKVIDAILTDAMSRRVRSNTRPYMVAVATGEVRDCISAELQRRWAIAGRAMRGSWWDKVMFFLKRDGLPTSDYQCGVHTPRMCSRAARRSAATSDAHIGVRSRRQGRSRRATGARNFDMFGAPVAIFFVYTDKGLPTYSVSDAVCLSKT